MASRTSGGACSTPSAVAAACLKSGSPAGCDCHFQLPDCVFNSATLAELELSSGMEVVAPKSVRLPRLKKLHLSSARRTDPSIAEKLISGCPALEVLCLSGCTLGSFKISSGTLKTLSITGCRHEGIHVSAPNTCYLRLSVFEGKAKVQIAGMPCLVSMENKSSGNLKLVPAFHRDLEVLRIRLSKDDDEIEEFQKLRGLLNEKIKAKVMAVVWF
ncbi:hypothetical protein BAE44_0021322 [Dichanthelium oligosanthes]|uniref:F-box/LRR-repeat protein 15/At3g58940/PEG3-like LRR domain-containing protein n=1 Tax=Dichanthelium oligosanthes TaxID=888268 RepID=A0A1E5UXZ3_9POAL|nr:hypothetical protein BAE44_0021322 [Dichanthelium oligosanthes]